MCKRDLLAAGWIKPAVLTGGLLTLLFGLDFPACAQAPNLITSAINPNQVTTLVGNTRPEAISQNDLGPVSDNLPLEHMMLQLRRSAAQEQALTQLIEQQHNPASPNFHHWLTAQEFGQRFGLSQQDLTAIANWLQAGGFTVNRIYPSGVMIDFSGTASQVRTAFGAEIHNLSVNGAAHIANINDPRIPAALAPAVVGIVSLNDFRPHPMRTARSNFAVGSSQLVAPADLATIYNLTPLFQQGITGAGQTVAVIEDTDVANAGDWSTFRSTFGLSIYPGSFTTVHPGCGGPGVTGDEEEAILDAEWASASAPGAAIQLVSCAGSPTTFGGLIAIQNVVNSASPPSILSLSYGECEADNRAANNAAYNTIYQQAVTLGISIFVSSGDSGAAGCDASSATSATHGIGVNGFASTPYNVAVGGTDFGDTYAGTGSTYWNSSNTATFGSAKSYVPEIPWDNSCASLLIANKNGYSVPYGAAGFCNSAAGKNYQTVVAGSGGPSSCATGTGGSCAGYGKPLWQSGFAGIPNDGVRDLPDVSLFAANGIWGHYYVYCDSHATSCAGAPNTWSGGGGTSFSAPIMAGIQALVNQKAGGAQGNPNTVYYSLAATEYGSGGNASCNSTSGNAVSGSCIFYDVTQGDMTVNCTSGANCYLPSGTVGILSTTTGSPSPAFGTTTGWDFATGIGTLNAYNLVMNWPNSGGTTYTIHGQVTLSGGGNLSGVTVTLSGGSSSSTTTDSSGNFSFTSLAAGNSYTVTPSLAGYTFTPPSQTFNSLGANQVANFTASAASQITIQTIPAGLQFTVDSGFPQTAPQTVSLAPGQHTIAVSATQGDGAGTQDVFVSWSDGGAPSHIITVSGSASYTATFQTQYQLTIGASPGAGGSVTPASGTFYNSGAVVAINALANNGYVFANWSGNVASTGSASTSVTMTAPQTVTANFTSRPNITIQTIPSGLLFSVDNGAAMAAPQTLNLSVGQHTIAVATSQNNGSGTQAIFDSWSDGGAASHTINVSGPATYTATFQAQYQLTIAASPSAGGTVTPNSGIFYNSGTVVAINAVASSGFLFTGWSGNVANSGIAATSVTMNAPQTVTANFTSNPSVTIQTSPAGLQFSVDGGNAQIAPQTLQLTNGSHTIAVLASQNGSAGTQYIFSSWSDGGAASHTINVSGPATYTATYQTQYQLTISASPTAGGTVTPNSGIFYNSGAVVAINASANSGYNFVNWSGSVASSGAASTSVTMSAPQTVTANFALIPIVTIQTVPSGLQFSLDGGNPQTAPQTIVVTAGQHTIAVASSQSGGAGTQYIFNSWSDGGAASHTVNVNGPVTYTATYQAQYQLTISASPTAGGTVTPNSGIFYNAGTVVAINATANSGYNFANWSGSVANSGIAATSVTMNAPQTVTANFAIPACSFSIPTTSVSLSATGTSTAGFYPSVPQSFTLAGNSACAGVSWSATTSDISPAAATPSMFVSLTSGASGTGPGTISFNAFANTHQAARSATITIVPTGGAALTFTVNEAGSTQSMLNRETQALYQRSLGREPDTSGFRFWTCTTPLTVSPCSNLGVSGLGQMVDEFLQSPEGMSSDFQVLAVYQAFLGRLPVFAEWFNAVAPFRANDTPAGWSAAATALISTLTNSTEYASRYGSPANINSVVGNLYQNMLHRAPSSAELSSGLNIVTNSGLIGLFTTIFSGAEFRNTGAFASSSASTDHSNSLFVTMIYFAVLARDPDSGGYTFWTGVANSGGAGIYFQPGGTTGAAIRFQVEGPGAPNQGLVGSIEFQSLFAN